MEDEGGELKEPLRATDARQLIRSILGRGGEAAVHFTTHALAAMAKDELGTVDCVNVLQAGVVEEAELTNGAWRHRVRTQRMAVVIEFRSASAVVIVTAWRFKP